MWWADALRGERGERGRLVLVLRCQSWDAGWLQPGAAGQAAQWCTAQVLLPAAAAPGTAGEGGAGIDLQAAAAVACEGLRQRLADPAAGLQAGAGQRWTVLVAPPWLGLAAVPWSDALLHEAGAAAHAQAHLAARGFEPVAEDRLSIDAGPAIDQPRSAMQLPGWLLQGLGALAAGLGARLASIQPLQAVAAGWAQRSAARLGGRGGPRPALKGAPLLGLWSADALRLTDAHGLASQPGCELSGQLPGLDEAGLVARLWQRARLRFPGLQAQARLAVLALDRPPPAAATAAAGDGLQWLPWPEAGQSRAALDRALLRQAARRHTLDALPQARASAALLLPAVSALCLVAAGVLGWQAWQMQQALQQGLQQRLPQQRQLGLQQAQPPAPEPAAPAPVRRADGAPAGPSGLALLPSDRTEGPERAGRADGAEVRAVNAAVRQLNLPLGALLQALQPPRDIVIQLMAVDVARQGGRDTPLAPGRDGAASVAVKLAAEAASAQDMTRYLDFLAARDGIHAVQLARHDIESTAADGSWRFTLDLTWQR